MQNNHVLAKALLRVFIASTTEGLELAHLVENSLKRPGFEPLVWNEQVAESLFIMENIEVEIDKCDFAIVTATPDDFTISRDKIQKSPRDNLIFELGFFMGRLGPLGALGRIRTYLLLNDDNELKRPTDLSGYVEARISRKKGQSQQQAVDQKVDDLCKRMKTIGARNKPSIEEVFENSKKKSFCDQIIGTWWEINSVEGQFYGLSLFDIKPKDNGTNVYLNGSLVGLEGQIIADWYSTAAVVYPDRLSVSYLWEGKQNTEGGFLGVGRFDIQDSNSKPYQSGTGKFITVRDFDAPSGSEGSFGNDSPKWKQVKLRRADASLTTKFGEIIHNGNMNARKRMVARILDKYNIDF